VRWESEEMKIQAEQPVAEKLALSEKSSRPSSLGPDIRDAMAQARALSRASRTAEALALLQQKDAAEQRAQAQAETEQQLKGVVERRVIILTETAQIQRAARDYPSAKATLSEIVRLDPKNGWALVELGDIETICGLTADALAAFEQALAVDRVNGDDRHIALALERIGDVVLAQGDVKGAVRNYGEALEIVRRLAEADPSHAERARDVAISLSKLASVADARGDAGEALKKCREARQIFAGLAEKSPGWKTLQRDIAFIDARIAELEGEEKP
jgi:tetratricopeptide (TPR) repeat protein